jgi:hypothetical protein
MIQPNVPNATAQSMCTIAPFRVIPAPYSLTAPSQLIPCPPPRPPPTGPPSPETDSLEDLRRRISHVESTIAGGQGGQGIQTPQPPQSPRQFSAHVEALERRLDGCERALARSRLHGPAKEGTGEGGGERRLVLQELDFESYDWLLPHTPLTEGYLVPMPTLSWRLCRLPHVEL